jgi:hypothetical protein
VEVLANPSVQRSLLLALAMAAAAGAAMFLWALWTARGPLPNQTRVFRRRVGAVGLFVVVAAGAALAVLRQPVDAGTGEETAVAGAGDDSGGVEVSTNRRFSSAKLPALSLDAPEGWTLALDEKGHKLTAAGGAGRLLVSSAILTDAVDVEAMLRQLAGAQRELGFEVGDTFTDRIGEVPAAGFLAKGPTRSICTWMVKRDTRLATSLICTSETKVSARDACRAPIAAIRWRAPAR